MNRLVQPKLRHPLRARYLILPGVIAWALLVRLHGLDAASMWMDELRQISYYYGDWRTVMYNAAAQAQTPLDYWVGRCMTFIGTSDFLLRLPAAICGTLAVLTTFLLARRLVSPVAAGLAACVVASAPFAIHYSQEARPYAIFWCLQGLTLVALSRAWRRNGWFDWAVLAVTLGACLLSRTLAPLAFSGGIAAWSVVEVWRGRRVRRRRGTASHVPWWRRRSVRLWGVLVVLWLPVLQLLMYIMRVQRRRAYLAGEVADAFNWQENLATLGHIVRSWWSFTLPIGLVLVPLTVLGTHLLLQRRGRSGRDARMLVVTFCVGYLVHVGTYVVMVAGVEPKHVYWAYMLPYCAIAGVVAVERLAGRATRRGRRVVVSRCALFRSGVWPDDDVVGRSACGRVRQTRLARRRPDAEHRADIDRSGVLITTPWLSGNTGRRSWPRRTTGRRNDPWSTWPMPSPSVGVSPRRPSPGASVSCCAARPPWRAIVHCGIVWAGTPDCASTSSINSSCSCPMCRNRRSRPSTDSVPR